MSCKKKKKEEEEEEAYSFFMLDIQVTSKITRKLSQDLSSCKIIVLDVRLWPMRPGVLKKKKLSQYKQDIQNS